eukprot:TRINITY_DN4345_c0_g2_i3.p1 TRINITY_DN4345_c0_g2~~TRINITY_DN4345_c0_g2_i3.p1  ORF type:complete len:118 (-),score=24.04 TRINITY_DN4345_c0_g2_i3:229-582(-)
MICSHCLPHFRHSILGADSVFTNFLLRLFGIDVDFDDEKETETKEKDIDEAEQYRLDNISITIRDYAKTIAKLTAVRGFSMEDVDRMLFRNQEMNGRRDVDACFGFHFSCFPPVQSR